MAEVFKLKSSALSIRVRNESTKKWSDWSSWEPKNVLIIVNTDKERIKIFSAKQQVYDIVTKFSEKYDEDGDLIIKWKYVNEDGLICDVRCVRLYSQNDKLHLYVDFDDIMWVYEVYPLD